MILGGARVKLHSGRTIPRAVGAGEEPERLAGEASQGPRNSPARMKSKSWKAVLKRVPAMRLSWASMARKSKQLRKDRKPAPTAKLQAMWLLLRTQRS